MNSTTRYVYASRRPMKCAVNSTSEPTPSGGGVFGSADSMLSYHRGAFAGSAAYPDTVSAGLLMVISVTTSTSAMKSLSCTQGDQALHRPTRGPPGHAFAASGHLGLHGLICVGWPTGFDRRLALIGCIARIGFVQLRQLAARLRIDVDEHRWPGLVQAATFESMRSKAGTTVPGGGPEHWIDPAAFFSRGTSGQRRDLLDDADLTRYAARVRALASGNLVQWVHREPID